MIPKAGTQTKPALNVDPQRSDRELVKYFIKLNIYNLKGCLVFSYCVLPILWAFKWLFSITQHSN